MRLTLALLKRKMPNGYIWAGKHRLAHHVYPDNIDRMVKRLQVEEKNMLFLRHPYLSVDQEKGHTQPFNKRDDFLARMNLYKAAVRVRPSVRLEAKFDKLRATDSWDV